MPKPKKIQHSLREKVRKRVLDAVEQEVAAGGGKIIPGDRVIVGADELVAALARVRPDLAKSRRYELAQTIREREFVYGSKIGDWQVRATMASSHDHCAASIVPEEAAARRAAHDWQAIGKRGGRPRTRSDDGTRRTLVSGGTLTYPHE